MDDCDKAKSLIEGLGKLAARYAGNYEHAAATHALDVAKTLAGRPFLAGDLYDLLKPPVPSQLTITIEGPQGCGKTRMADVLRGMDWRKRGLPCPAIVDGGVA